MKTIKPSPTMAITQKAKELKASGLDVIDLGAGEPDFETPDNIKKAANKAINDGKTRYTAVSGIIELKEAICKKFSKENNLDYKSSNIIVSTGAKQIIFNAMLATLNKGDEVIISAPYWVSYVDMVAFAEGTPVIITSQMKDGFKITASQLEAAITDKTKWVIINSPSNPSGTLYSKEELKALAEVLLRFPNVQILSDDIYEHIVFDDYKFYTIAQVESLLKDRTLTVNGVSKSYAMTGWRIGYAAGMPQLINAMSEIQSQSTSNPCSISQYAALEALTGPQDFIPQNAKIFEKRRDLTVELLSDIPNIQCSKPDGAFYLFPSCENFVGMSSQDGFKINNSQDFTSYLLAEGLVAVVPGSAFGLENHFRISIATSEDNLKEACKRIKEACSKLS